MNPWGTRARRFRVGLLVLGCTALFVALLAFVCGRSLSEEVVEYRIPFAVSVKGMVVGSKVNFQGVPLGTVGDIRFVRGRTVVTIKVDPRRAVVQTVTKARLDRLLVTGQVTVELEGYQEGGEPLAPGGTIETSESPLDKLTKSLPEVLEQAGRVLDGIEGLLANAKGIVGEQNAAAVSATLSNLERASRELPLRLEALVAEATPLVKEIDKTLVSLRATSHDFGEVARSPELAQALAELRRATEQLAKVETSLLATVDEAGGMLRSSRSSLIEALRGAGGAFAELQRLVRDLRLQPAALLYGRRLDAAAEPPREGK